MQSDRRMVDVVAAVVVVAVALEVFHSNVVDRQDYRIQTSFAGW
jgi:hypothetical protein